MTTRSPSPRWTQDAVKSARNLLAARIEMILRSSESQLRQDLKSTLGFSPDSTVTHEALRRWLVGVAIDQAFPNTPPLPQEPTHV